MITNLLVKKFVRDYENVQDIKVRERYGVLSSFVGIVCNIILFSAKFIIGMFAHSIAIISDGFNNLSDCATCVVTMFGYKMAAKPADRDHPFGHGRMEYLTSLIISAVIMLVGCELLKTSVEKIVHPEKVTFSVVALLVLILSIGMKVWMGFFNRKLGKKVNSSIMLATSQDSFSDVFATLATLVALVASIWTDLPIDGIMGLVVSVLILRAGFEIMKDTTDQLLGTPADEELVEKLNEFVNARPVSKGMHDLIIHNYGPGNMIGSLHVEVDCREDIMEIHDAIDVLEHDIYEEFKIQMTIHMDPIDPDDEHTAQCKHMMNEILESIHEKLSLHDFRVVSGSTHTNLIFDVVIPYECEYSVEEIQERINEALKGKDTLYFTVITFDKTYY